MVKNLSKKILVGAAVSALNLFGGDIISSNVEENSEFWREKTINEVEFSFNK